MNIIISQSKGTKRWFWLDVIINPEEHYIISFDNNGKQDIYYLANESTLFSEHMLRFYKILATFIIEDIKQVNMVSFSNVLEKIVMPYYMACFVSTFLIHCRDGIYGPSENSEKPIKTILMKTIEDFKDGK